MVTCPRCQRSFDDGVRFCPIDGALVVGSVDPAIARNIGRVLYGQFELRELAGRGATGTVWRAYQKAMDRIVAVKILHSELASDPDVVRRFLREARAIARITHPNIITVHLVGETDEGTPYLVMEHVDGISLETIVEAQGPQAIGRVVHLGRQIAAGLGEAHANGIIHRDLKPANLLVTDRGRVADQVKILDFGIAKLVQPGGEHSQLTRGQQIFGTPHYMAPEQATGENIDARTDLYSLGVVLFRLVTGQVPFDAPAAMQVVLRHLRDAPPRPSTFNPLVPEQLETLIMALLSKSPANRPTDAEDVIAALDELVDTAPTGARKSLASVRLTPPQPPQPARLASKSTPSAAASPSESQVTSPGTRAAATSPSVSAPMAWSPRSRNAPMVSGEMSGIIARPPLKPARDRTWLWVGGILVFAAIAVLAVTRLEPSGTTETTDLAIAAPKQDFAINIVDTPDRNAPDLAVGKPQDMAKPPDMAKKHHHHSDDDDNLPTTVFGPGN